MWWWTTGRKLRPTEWSRITSLGRWHLSHHWTDEQESFMWRTGGRISRKKETSQKYGGWREVCRAEASWAGGKVEASKNVFSLFPLFSSSSFWLLLFYSSPPLPKPIEFLSVSCFICIFQTHRIPEVQDIVFFFLKVRLLAKSQRYFHLVWKI